MTSEDDRDCRFFLSVAKALSKKMKEYDLRPEKIEAEETVQRDGWCACVATWSFDRPKVQIWFDNLLRKDRKVFWFGFSGTSHKIKKLIDDVQGSVGKPVKVGDADFPDNEHPLNRRKRREIEQNDGLAWEAYNGTQYFGKYAVGQRRFVTELVTAGAGFIGKVVRSAPINLGGIDRREREYIRRLVRDRQPRFRRAVLDAYDGKCCLSGCAVESCIETAHIDRFASSGNNKVTNGIALRADLHRLFDAKLLTFSSSNGALIARLDRSVRNDACFSNINGVEVRLPRNRAYWPAQYASLLRSTNRLNHGAR